MEMMQNVLSQSRFGQKGGNYDLVIASARHYWNAIKPFIVEPIERELLREPMEAVLECIAAVAVKEVGKEDEVRKELVDVNIIKNNREVTRRLSAYINVAVLQWEVHGNIGC